MLPCCRCALRLQHQHLQGSQTHYELAARCNAIVPPCEKPSRCIRRRAQPPVADNRCRVASMSWTDPAALPMRAAAAPGGGLRCTPHVGWYHLAGVLAIQSR